ncbi:MAG: hypothetical protein ACK4UN_16190 [Limisphaerales bacterium]
MKSMLCLFLLVILSGCATTPPTRPVQVDSDPRGARVYFGIGINEGAAEKASSYIGTTPFVWEAPREFKFDGALVYSTFVPPAAVIRAVPADKNLPSQKKVFHGGTVATPADKVPSALFFDWSRESN